MLRSSLHPRLLVGLTALAALLPVTAAQARQPAAVHAVRGTVLTVDRQHHRAQVLTRQATVRTVRYRRATRGLAPGSVVTAAAGTVTATGRARSATLPATITPTGAVSANGVPLAVSIAGLAPGTKVTLTLRFADGGFTLMIEVTGSDEESPGGDDDESGDGAEDCGPSATFGTVGALNRVAGRLTLILPSGGRAVWPVDAGQLDGVAAGDEVIVAVCGDKVTAITKRTDAQTTISGVVVRADEDNQQVILRTGDGTTVALDLPAGFASSFEVSDAVVALVHADPSGDLVVDAVAAQEDDDQ